MAEAGRWQRVKDVFQAALDRPADERARFLAEICGDDAGLRDEVESLLGARQEAGEFLSRPAVSVPASPEADGRHIGPYRLLSRIGHGGMGVVYRAVRDDDVFRKTVALKVVHGDASAEHLRRLGRERQILARLQHPNIATILDGGTTDEGRPYLVMEYVEGEAIDAYCNGHGLGTRQRLEMFRTVCGAVHNAHQNLVVHRDLKPQNILVTADGQPKLLDFGIAKLLAAGVDPEDAPTATLLPMMTPEYASPEQVRGQTVTTASDVYSLGVILYELLTGARPYEVRADSLEGIVRVVCETEPRLPSATGPAAAVLRGDLDTILLKALRKDPSRRYLSAQEMSEDIRRHLQGLPVLARADSVTYRAGKFVGRHRVAVAATALVMLSLIGGIVMTARQARIAEVQRRRAERRFSDVRKLANSFLFEFHDAIADLPGATKARELVVKRALEYLDGLAGEAGEDGALQGELASAYERVGDVQGLPYVASLGDAAGALRSFERAYAIRLDLLRHQPGDPERLAGACQAGTRIGRVLLSRGEAKPALARFQEALPWCDGAWRKRADAASADTVLRTRLMIADALRRSGEPGRAVEGYQGVLRQAEEIARSEPSARKILAMTYDRLGQTLEQQGEIDASLRARRKFVEVAEQIARDDPGVPRYRRNVAVGYENLASALRQKGDDAAGLEAVEKAVAIYETQRRQDPSDAQAVLDAASARTSRAELLRGTGRHEEALAAFGDALALAEGEVRRNPDSIFPRALAAASLGGIGEIHLAKGRLRPSVEALQRAVEEREAIQARDPQYPENRHQIAALGRSLGRAHAVLAPGSPAPRREACRWYDRALETLRALRAAGVAPVPAESEVDAVARERAPRCGH